MIKENGKDTIRENEEKRVGRGWKGMEGVEREEEMK
jgi:hypothetical protein